jgi:hypothetical protein
MAQTLLLDIKLSVQSTSSSVCPKGHRVVAWPSLAGSFVFLKLLSITDRDMDKEGVEFHVSANDYFGTLATVLSLCAQDLEAGGSTPEEIAEALSVKADELLYLQDKYRLCKNATRVRGEPAGCQRHPPRA